MEAWRMMLDRNSVNAGYAAAMKRMSVELQQFKQESASAFFELRRELDAALEQVRATQLEFLNYKCSVTRDRQTLAALNHERALVQAQLTQFDPQTMQLQ